MSLIESLKYQTEHCEPHEARMLTFSGTELRSLLALLEAAQEYDKWSVSDLRNCTLELAHAFEKFHFALQPLTNPEASDPEKAGKAESGKGTEKRE